MNAVRLLSLRIARIKLRGLLLLLALFTATVPAEATITFVQSLGTGGTGGAIDTTASVTTTGTVTAGNTILVFVATNNGSDTITCSDPVNGTYTTDVNAGSLETAVCSKHNALALPSGSLITVTVSPNPTNIRVSVAEFSGLAAASQLDRTAVTGGTSTSPSVTLGAATRQAAELLIGVVNVNDSGTGVIFTEGTNGTSNNCTNTGSPTYGTLDSAQGANSIFPIYCIVAATATYRAAGSLSTSQSWTAAMATYRAFLVPTSTSISLSAATVIPGTAQTFTAGVTANSAAVTSGTVTFTDTTTATTLASNVALDSNGRAAVTVTLANGGHTIQATYNPDPDHAGSNITAAVAVNAPLGPRVPATATIIAGSPQSAAVNTAFPTALQVTIKDQFGVALPNTSIGVVAPSSGPGLSVSSIAVTTDGSGFASVNVSANTVAGTYGVSFGGAIFRLTNTAGAASTITATEGTLQSASSGDLFSVPLQATVRDAFGNAVPDVTVTFSSAGTSNANAAFPYGAIASTNSAGRASAAVRANFAAGSYTVNASAPGAGTAVFTLTNNARSRMFVPALTTGPANQLGVAWTNPLAKPVTLTLTARDYDGQTINGTGITNPAQLTVPAQGQIARQSVEIFGAGISGRSGWIEVVPSDTGGNGFFLFYDAGLNGVDGDALIQAPASQLYFPQVNPNTILHVVNTGNQATNAALFVYTNDGSLAGRTLMSIAGKGGWSGRIGNLLPSLTAVEGYAVVDTQWSPFSARVPVLTGMEGYQAGRDIAIVRAQDDSARARSGYAVHVMSGEGYSSRLKLVNSEELAQRVRLTLNGTSSENTIPPHGRIDVPINGSGVLKIETLTPTMLGVNGYVEITGIDGIVTAESILTDAARSITFSHVAQGNGFYTGLALFNPDSSPATVSIEVHSVAGAVMASQSVTIEPNKRVIGLLSDLFPAIRTQMGGSVRITSSVPLYALQLFGTAGPGGGNFLSSVPPGY